MAEAIQDPIQDATQGPIAAVDRQDGRFSFGEIHEYVVRGVNPEGFTKENKQALRKGRTHIHVKEEKKPRVTLGRILRDFSHEYL